VVDLGGGDGKLRRRPDHLVGLYVARRRAHARALEEGTKVQIDGRRVLLAAVTVSS